jgi:ribosome-binding protein aMBF1 (putative translation factor)
MHPLAVARKARDMSQVKLARLLEIDPSIVRHVEAGRVKPYPRFRRLCSQFLELPEEELFGDSLGPPA